MYVKPPREVGELEENGEEMSGLFRQYFMTKHSKPLQ